MARAAKPTGDASTLTLPGVPAKRGRPPTGRALSGAQRQSKYRQSHKPVETGDQIGATIRVLADQFDLTQAQVIRELLRFALCNRNWKQSGFPSLVTKKEAA